MKDLDYFLDPPELCVDIRHSAAEAWSCLLALVVVAALIAYLLLTPVASGVILAAISGPLLTVIIVFVFVRKLMQSWQQLEIREHGITRIRDAQRTTWLYENVQRIHVTRAKSELTWHCRFTIDGSDSGRLRFREEFLKEESRIARCENIAQGVIDRVADLWVRRLILGDRVQLSPTIAITADAIEISRQQIPFANIPREGTLANRDGKQIVLRTDSGVWALFRPSDWNYDLLLALLRRLIPHQLKFDEAYEKHCDCRTS